DKRDAARDDQRARRGVAGWADGRGAAGATRYPHDAGGRRAQRASVAACRVPGDAGCRRRQVGDRPLRRRWL
ncbi:MAG: hypothetical protein AVDCRST_MAG18-1918, partial [uncultured Thermomicrobiales bacterium]